MKPKVKVIQRKWTTRAILLALHRKVNTIMSKIDDLRDAVASLGEAIDTEIQQVKDLIAAGSGLTPEQQASLDESIAKITDATARLKSDDPTATPPPV